eukprot:12960665-Alexandrium_andersonii.AAC.1
MHYHHDFCKFTTPDPAKLSMSVSGVICTDWSLMGQRRRVHRRLPVVPRPVDPRARRLPGICGDRRVRLPLRLADVARVGF